MSQAGIEPEIDPCWRRIGVYGGDLSCPKLADVLHCRNCPTYHAAARSLFDRAVGDVADDDGFEPPAAAAADERSALAFRLGAQWFALPSNRLAELADDRPLRRLAHRTGGHLQGLVNIRGELQLCIALAAVLGLQGAGTEPASPRLVLFRAATGGVLAFRVDQVSGLLQYRPAQLQPAPATYAATLARCVAGIVSDGERRLALLDGDGLAAVLDEALYA